MQGSAWADLMRSIPLSHHDCLVFTISNGNEIVLQRLVRLETDFMVAQGRISGSNDQGMVMILPYDQITYVTFNKRMMDQEIQAVIGGDGTAIAGTMPAAPKESPVAAAVLPPAASMVAEPTPAPPAVAGKTALPAKSALLARLRERLATETKPANPNP
jgi:hypothetical protein